MSALSPARPRLLWPFAGLIVAFAVIAGLLTPMTAQAAPVALAGIVRGENGKTLASVGVTALKVVGGTQTPVATGTTGSGGTFSFPTLTAGTYTLMFTASAVSFAQYLGGSSAASEAQLVTLNDAGVHESFVAVALAPSGSFTGSVKSATGGALAKFTVDALAQDDTGEWMSFASATTSSKGTYTLTGLEPGSYVVRARGSQTLYSGKALTLAQATPRGVLPEKTTTVNLVGIATGGVTGTVIGASGSKVSGVVVTAHRLGTSGGGWDKAETTGTIATSKANGSYTITGLMPGSYTLRFSPPAGSPYASVFLGGSASPLTAASFMVSSNYTTTGMDAQLTATGSISGVVSSTAPVTSLANIALELHYAGSVPGDGHEPLARTLTDASGHYEFSAIGAGNYVLYAGSHTIGDTTRARLKVTVSAVGFAEDRVVPIALSLKGVSGIQPLSGSLPTVTAPNGYQVGRTAVVSTGTWSVATPLTYSFQWYRDGKQITGATTNAHTFTPGDAGHSVTARVSAKDFAQGVGRYTTIPSPAVQVAAAPHLVGAAPAVTGSLIVGQTMTAHSGEWSADNMQFDYQWQGSDSAVGPWDNYGSSSGRTFSNYDLSYGPYFRLAVTASRQGYADTQPYYVYLGKLVKGDFVNTKLPAVKKSGSTLTATSGTWSPKPDSYETLWRIHNLDGSTSTATGTKLNLNGLAGKYVTVSVAPHYLGFNDTYKTVVAQTGTLPKPSGSLAIGGQARVGSTLVAPFPGWSTSLDATLYQWSVRSGSTYKPIAGATGSSFVVPAALQGKQLRVTLSAVKSGYATQKTNSTTTPAVAVGAALSLTSLAKITGYPAAGETVTADPGIWSPAATSFSYQWKWTESGSSTAHVIPGGTKSTLVVPAGLASTTLSVEIVAKRAGHLVGTTGATTPIFAGALVNTALPKVSHVGTVYSATTGSWNPTATTTEIEWYQHTVADQPLTFLGQGANFDTASAAANRPVSFTVIASAGGYSSGYSPFILARPGTLVPATALDITAPNATTFEWFTAPQPDWGPTSTNTAYQWQIKSGTQWKDLTSATDLSHGSREVQLGLSEAKFVNSDIRVRMTVTSPHYTTLVTYSNPKHISIKPAPVPDAGGEPSFDGTPHIGELLTVTGGSWSFDGGKNRFQWLESADGTTFTAIQGATSASYRIPVTRFGYSYQVRVSLENPGVATGVTTVSAGPPAGNGTLRVTKAPTVAHSGGILTASTGTWNPAPSSFDYQWERVATNGSSVVVASTKSYSPVALDAGQQLRVTVTAHRDHYYDAESTVVAQLGAAPQPSISLYMDGAATLSSVVWVPVALWPNGTIVTQQWYRNSTPIAGEGANNYFTQPADLGKRLTLKITAKRPGYQTAIVDVTSPIVTSGAAPVATVAPIVTMGYSTTELQVDQYAVASSGTWSVPGVALTYQWLRSGVAIDDATTSKYLLTAKDENEEITVRVTARKAFYPDGSATSAAFTITQANGLDWMTTVKLSGSGKLGEKLTMATFEWVDQATATYQWQRYSAGSWLNLPGVTSRTFTPTTALGFAKGDHVRVLVTATRPGNPTLVWDVPSVTLK